MKVLPLHFKAAAGMSVALAAAAVAMLAVTPVASVSAQDNAVHITGTIYGAFDYSMGAWVGHAILTFGDGKPVTATFIDRNTSFGQRKNGAIYGTETISLTLLDGSGTVEIPARFDGVPSQAPSLYTLHETGQFANGTGRFAGAAGHVAIHGPFLFPDPDSTPGAPPWIAEIHGTISGLR